MRARFILLFWCAAFLAMPAGAEVKLGGYLSAQYEKGESESQFPDGTFGQARAGLFLTGTAEGVIDYTLELQMKSEAKLELEEAWVGFSPSSAFHLKLGVYLVPFGRYNTAHRAHQVFYVQPPLTQAQIYPESWRDVGVLAEGSSKVFRYAVYIGNGLKEDLDLSSGQQFQDNNKNKSWGGRAGLMLSRTFVVGLSYSRGKYDEANERDLEYRGADVSWNTEAFQFLYEYTEARIENPADFAAGRASGHFGLLALSWQKFYPFVSYQTFEYKDPFHGPDFGLPGLPGSGISSEGSRWAIGLSYLVASGLLVKAEYDFNEEKGTALNDDCFLAQVAFRF